MDKMNFETPDGNAANIAKIAELFPAAVSDEGKINFETLRTLLGDEIYGDEAYEFTWVGKREAVREAGRPVRRTLRPCPEESKEWDTTENLYIEGDNLDVLKLLQESYLGKVKMIYIDPPYNTGSDFVYRDNFAVSREDYEDESGVYDDEGDRLFKNTETNGRFHSDWCSMIYPRLVLARNLLHEDGSIFISIDDNEVENLKKILCEVFGAANFIAQFVWAAGRKNDSKLVSISHEYILCFAKSRAYFQENQTLWRERKQGLDEIYATYDKLVKQYGADYASVQVGLKEWYKSLPKTHASKNHSHYSCVDEHGIYFAADISWPGGGGPRFEVLHPKTQKPVRVPARGWMFGSIERMNEVIAENRVHFGADETSVPCIKSYLADHETSAPYSVFYQDGRASTKRLRTLLGDDVFENPKDEEIVKNIVEFVGTQDGIVLDFFSGSGTTAHAVMQMNAIDNGHRKFILVQLPENCDAKSKAAQAGYASIPEIGKERIRRAGDKIKSGLANRQQRLGFSEREYVSMSAGFGYWLSRLETRREQHERCVLCGGRLRPEPARYDDVEYQRRPHGHGPALRLSA
jgi:adenine-specific DNA-methyltransferase